MRRLRGEEEGMALVVAITVMTIVLALVGAAVAYSVHSLNRSSYDRATTRALEAADGGLDVAGWRMNKSIVADQVSGILSIPGTNGLLNQVVQTLGCTNLTVQGSTLVGGSWCNGTPEALDNQGGTGAGETFQYYTDLSLNVDLTTLLATTPSTALITRKVVSVGTAGGRRAVVEGLYTLDLNGFLTSLHLFTLRHYAQCSGESFSASNPTAGCPSV